MSARKRASCSKSAALRDIPIVTFIDKIDRELLAHVIQPHAATEMAGAQSHEGDGGWAEPGLSVDTLLRTHLSFIHWVKQIAFYVLPNGWVVWVFALPALILFPVRGIVSTLIGAWALSAARRMPHAAGIGRY